jgi:hypothetical protein
MFLDFEVFESERFGGSECFGSEFFDLDTLDSEGLLVFEEDFLS